MPASSMTSRSTQPPGTPSSTTPRTGRGCCVHCSGWPASVRSQRPRPTPGNASSASSPRTCTSCCGTAYRPRWSVAVGDAFGAVAEGAEVLVAAVFGDQLVGAGEAPALVLDGDSGPAAAEVAAAGLAGPWGVAAEGLEVLLDLAAGSAGILVDGHPVVSRQVVPSLIPSWGRNDRGVVRQVSPSACSGPARRQQQPDNEGQEPDGQVDVAQVVDERRQERHVEEQDVDEADEQADDDGGTNPGRRRLRLGTGRRLVPAPLGAGLRQ